MQSEVDYLAQLNILIVDITKTCLYNFDPIKPHFYIVKGGLQEYTLFVLFVCVEVLRPSQPNGVMSSTVSLPNHTFTGQA